jgi:hypothetical protein
LEEHEQFKVAGPHTGLRNDMDDPIFYQPYVPGKVCVSTRWFFVLCALSFVGVLTLLFVVFS